MFITPQMCKDKGMLDAQYSIFVGLFPNGHETDGVMATQGSAAGLNLKWLVQAFCSTPVPQDMQAVVDAAVEAARVPYRAAAAAYQVLKDSQEAAQALALDNAILPVPPPPGTGPNMVQYLAVVAAREAMKAETAAVKAIHDSAITAGFTTAFTGR